MGEQGGKQDQLLSGVLRSRLSKQSVQVLFYARRELSLRPRKTLEPEYVMLGLIRAEPSATNSYLARGWTIERLETALNLTTDPDASVLPEHVEVPLSPAVVALLQRAVVVADELRSPDVRPPHLLLALLEDESLAVVRLLREAGVTRERILEVLRHGREF